MVYTDLTRGEFSATLLFHLSGSDFESRLSVPFPHLFIVFCELSNENRRIHSDPVPDIEFFSRTGTNNRYPTNMTEQG
jgi:hypothetical protein